MTVRRARCAHSCGMTDVRFRGGDHADRTTNRPGRRPVEGHRPRYLRLRALGCRPTALRLHRWRHDRQRSHRADRYHPRRARRRRAAGNDTSECAGARHPHPDPCIPLPYWVAKPELSSPDIHHYGEPVALVVATTFEQARAASSLVDVEYAAEPGHYDFLARQDQAYAPKTLLM